jgi:hypothetical protein
MSGKRGGKGGRGGDAQVEGDRSFARGGVGGEGVTGSGGRGGRGGHARVFGDGISAIGGKGGRAGIGDGMPGHDVPGECVGDLIIGGMGGEASQRGGRGGRGGRSPGIEQFGHHVKLPYGAPNNEPGRGGDAPDTPQYMARRIIVEQLKECYLAQRGLGSIEAWSDREVVPLEWINEQLRTEGHRWCASVVDHEYEFLDCQTRKQ